jgi:2-dehydropantoate 2-reductase
MRFLIAGAGAIGAYIGARMAQAGFDVTLFARGPYLRAMQERGVLVKSAEGDLVARPAAASPLEELEPPDVLFLGVKAHRLPQLAPQLKPVLVPDTTVVSTQNEFHGGTSRVSAANGKDCAWSASIPAG